MKLGSDFYNTTAQIIPVVILALAVEERYAKQNDVLSRHPLQATAWQAFVMTVLTLGEIAALAGSLGSYNRITAAVTLVSIGFGGVQLIGPIALGQSSESEESTTSPTRSTRRPLVLMTWAWFASLLPLIAAVSTVVLVLY